MFLVVAVAAPEREDVREDVVGRLQEEPLVRARARRRRRAAALAEGREPLAEGEELLARRVEPRQPAARGADGGEEVSRWRPATPAAAHAPVPAADASAASADVRSAASSATGFTSTLVDGSSARAGATTRGAVCAPSHVCFFGVSAGSSSQAYCIRRPSDVS